MSERRIVRFFGWVQGVGFRYTVERIAARFRQVAGEVYNEDRHVTLDIEGPTADLVAFVDDIVEHLPGGAQIESTETVGAPLTGRVGFHVGRTR
jgi:hydrogenase maturation factor HypF (carbamoyltransferase family)